MNFFHHKDLGNHLLQLCLKVVKQPVDTNYMFHYSFAWSKALGLSSFFLVHLVRRFCLIFINSNLLAICRFQWLISVDGFIAQNLISSFLQSLSFLFWIGGTSTFSDARLFYISLRCYGTRSVVMWSEATYIFLSLSLAFILWMDILQDSGPTEVTYEGWNFNSGNYLFTTDTK